jgi:hypothetical protein
MNKSLKNRLKGHKNGKSNNPLSVKKLKYITKALPQEKL